MQKRAKLTTGQLETALGNLSGWEIQQEKLHKTFLFEDF